MDSPDFDHMSSVYPHQQDAFDGLLSTARVFFSRSWRRLPIAPRFTRLIVGPTGSGKTHLVRRLSEKLGLPMMELSASNWILLGCSQRGANPTWPELAQFCFGHRRGLIFVDELDKLHGKSDWQTHLRVEIFSLLDQRIPANVEPPTCVFEGRKALRLATARLRRAFFVVGAGAFQELWEKREAAPIGFHDTALNVADKVEQGQLSAVVPREIVNRFVSPILTLQPLKEADYRRMLDVVSKQLPFALRHSVRRRGEMQLRHAVSNRLGCRWIEELLLQALIEQELSSRLLKNGGRTHAFNMVVGPR